MSHRNDIQDLTDQKLRKIDVFRVNFSKIDPFWNRFWYLSQTSDGLLDSGPIFPSSMGFNGLGEIGPESNGPIFVHELNPPNFQNRNLYGEKASFSLVLSFSPQKKVETHLLTLQRHSQLDCLYRWNFRWCPFSKNGPHTATTAQIISWPQTDSSQ